MEFLLFSAFLWRENIKEEENLPWCSVKMLLDPIIRESFGTLGLRLDRIDETAPRVERFGLGSFTDCWLPIILNCFFFLISLIFFKEEISQNFNPRFELINFATFLLHTMALFHFSLHILSLSHPKYWTIFFFHFIQFFFSTTYFHFGGLLFPIFQLLSTITAQLCCIFYLFQRKWLRFSLL